MKIVRKFLILLIKGIKGGSRGYFVAVANFADPLAPARRPQADLGSSAALSPRDSAPKTPQYPLALIPTAVLFAALLAAVSCSRAEPKILFQAAKLVYYQTGTGYEQRLTFFVLPDDPDGPEDLDELYLYHDLEGLSWKMTGADWIQRQQDNRLWIGSYDLAPPPGEKIPSGLYRAVIIDKGGEKSERTFGFEVPETPRYPFPELAVAEGQYTVKDEYPERRFIGFAEDGSYLVTVPVPAFSGQVKDLRFANNVVSFALWADDPERSTAALTNSYPAK